MQIPLGEVNEMETLSTTFYFMDWCEIFLIRLSMMEEDGACGGRRQASVPALPIFPVTVTQTWLQMFLKMWKKVFKYNLYDVKVYQFKE